MKKLKLYAWKNEQGDPKRGRFVATVYAKDGKLFIEAETSALQNGLYEAIGPGAYGRGFRLAPSRHEPGTYETVNDPGFLEALRRASGLWNKRYGDGWSIHEVMSKIVEE